ncbi:MAG: hypothetical protein Pg6A_11590 [Termitinemataceae bacterium]|nr:MAG: hypothetical protein Pg6A_11590 [Termitinemataceae bacterium]
MPKAEKKAEEVEESNLPEGKRRLFLSPLNSAMLWTMTGTRDITVSDFEKLKIAKNPGEQLALDDTGADPRPKPNSVFWGVPAKSASSIISLGVIGTDVDRFTSATSFNDVSYKSGFGYFGFDKDSLSAGVSRKFKNDAVTSLYYNGNIIEDIFAYISNNSLTNGKVGLGAEDSATGTSYDFMGDLKDRNNINSRSNIDLMFGKGGIGLTIGYSQKLFGLVKKSDAEPEVDGTDATINNSIQAALDNALVPHIELGLNFATQKDVNIKIALGVQADFHQHRELNKGEKIELKDWNPLPPPYTPTYTYTVTSATDKLVADYIEPAATLRLEVEFPSDSRSQLGLALETGGRFKLYGAQDDKAKTVKGIFWSENTGDGNPYFASVTEKNLDLEVLARPSVRYVTSMGRLKVGLSGGFGVGFKFGDSTTKTYEWGDYADYLADDDPYRDGNLYSGSGLDDTNAIKTETPALDLGLYPNLGVGFSFEVVPDAFAVNGGVGGTQTLYRLRTGEKTTTDGGTSKTTPLLEQEWGKPLGQFVLGATFKFKEKFTLDAVFSSNGTSLDNSNFVLQLAASF